MVYVQKQYDITKKRDDLNDQVVLKTKSQQLRI